MVFRSVCVLYVSTAGLFMGSELFVVGLIWRSVLRGLWSLLRGSVWFFISVCVLYVSTGGLFMGSELFVVGLIWRSVLCCGVSCGGLCAFSFSMCVVCVYCWVAYGL